MALAAIILLSSMAGVTPALVDNASLGLAVPELCMLLGGAPTDYAAPLVVYAPAGWQPAVGAAVGGAAGAASGALIQ